MHNVVCCLGKLRRRILQILTNLSLTGAIFCLLQVLHRQSQGLRRRLDAKPVEFLFDLERFRDQIADVSRARRRSAGQLATDLEHSGLHCLDFMMMRL